MSDAQVSTELAVMKVLTPVAVFKEGGVDEVLGKIKAEVASIVPDISTEAGRKSIASVAYKIARSKTALDKMGKDLGESHYKAWKAITGERARIETELDKLKDEFRKPLTDWENAEKDRVAGHEDALNSIALLMMFNQEPSANEVALRIADLGSIARRDWQEFAKRAEDAIDGASKSLAAKLTAIEKREAEAAELARLRQEQIEREQRERDERIAREAAERARVEAERLAREEAERVAAAAEQERQRIEREKAQAEERAAQAERDRLASEERARQRAIDAAREADEARVAAAEQAERARVEAVENERRRAAAEQAAAAAETSKREADKKHRAKINNAARDAIAAAGITLDEATLVVTAIAKGEVPNVKISY